MACSYGIVKEYGVGSNMIRNKSKVTAKISYFIINLHLLLNSVYTVLPFGQSVVSGTII